MTAVAADIFVSYNREDKAIAQRIAEAFEGQGLSVWWDVTLRSGDAYDQVTEEALRSAKAVVVLWSKRSVVSRWVRAEATVADRNRTLVPLRIEPCDLPIMFELTQTADLSHWQGDASDPAWRAFLADVGKLVGEKAAPVPAPASAARSAAPARDARPSVAVLPFINRSGRSEDDVFADDMVEDVTMALSLNPWMGVVAASVTAAYRQGARDLRQIGRNLRARYLLEGNIRRAGENLRVAAQLVEAESGNILWTGRFDRPLTEVSTLQDELVHEVAAHLSVQVERAEVDHALKRPDNATAWEAFVRSVAYMARHTRQDFEAAIREAKRSISIDPDYALTYSNMATSAAYLWTLGGGAPDPWQEIHGAVRRARMLDPENPAVLAGSAMALCIQGKPHEALPLASRSVAVNSKLDYTRAALGMCLVMLGRRDEGLAELDAAERVGPNSAWGVGTSIWRSVAYLQSGRIEMGLEASNRALLLAPGCPFALVQEIICHASRNDLEAGKAALRRLQEADCEITVPIVGRIVRYLHGESPKASEYVAGIRQLWEDIQGEAGKP